MIVTTPMEMLKIQLQMAGTQTTSRSYSPTDHILATALQFSPTQEDFGVPLFERIPILVAYE